MARTFKSATVISVMPAMGKTYIAKKFPDRIRDLDYNEYYWMIDPKTHEFKLDENGKKIPNNSWPMNYIDAIKNLDKSGMYQAVLVSSHEEIRNLMAKNGIKYANVYPIDDTATKQELLARCVIRRSHPSFIEDYRENFSKYVESMKNDKGSVVNIGIDSKSIESWANFLFQN